MAVSFKGLTIKFGGDTTELQGALKSIQKETRNTQSDLKAINNSLKFNPGNTELLEQKVRTLNKAYDETKRKLDAYRDAMGQLEEKKQSGERLTEEEQRQYDALQRSVQTCENQLESYTKQLENATTEADASKTKIYQLGQTLEDNADSLKKHGERMETVGTAMIGASTAVTGASIAAFNEVDAGMDAVVKATGATGDAAQDLGQIVQNVATTVAGSSSDWETLGTTVGEVSTRFGFTGQDLEDCSERFLQFSEITGTDAVTAVQLVSRAMGDAGIDASDYGEVLDSLAIASQTSGIEVDRLAGLLTSYGAPMRALGFDTESAIAIFSQWELAGVNTETAFSGMKKAISNWSAEGKDAKVEFGKTLDEIAKCPDIATATTKAIEVFGAKAGPDLADAIQGGRFEYQDFLKVLEGSQGTVEKTFNETTDGVDQINVAQKELQIAGAELGAAFSDTLGPIISDFAGMVHDVAEAFKSLSPEQKEFVAKATLMVGAAGGLTLGLGKVFQAAGQIGGGLKSLAGIMPAVKSGWGAITGFIAANPIGLGIAAVAAAVAGLTWFFTQTETGKQMWADFTAWISEKWQAVQDFFAGVPAFWSGVWDDVTGKIDSVKQGIAATWDGLKQDAGVLRDTVGREWESMKTSVSTTADNLKQAVSDKWNQLKQDTQKKIDAIKQGVSDKWNGMKSDVSNIANTIKTQAIEKWEGIKRGVHEKVDGIRNGISEKLTAAKDKALGIFDDMKNRLKEKVQWAYDQISSIVENIKGLFNFSWSLPKPSLPHITWSWQDVGGIVSIPAFGIDWYAKGNAIFEPNNPHLIGVGDNRTEREYLNTESQLTRVVENAMRNVSSGPAELNVEVNVNARITGSQSAYQLGQDIGRGISRTMKQRGVAYA